MEEHEKAFISRFVPQPYRGRCKSKNGIPRKDLWHNLVGATIPKKTVELPGNIHVYSRVIRVLQELTELREGFLISAHSDLDGSMSTLEPLHSLQGTIVSLIPGELAFYQSESGPPRTYQCFLIENEELRNKANVVIKELSSEYLTADRGR